MTTAISTKGLSKDYGAGRGLFDLDLDVDQGEVFGHLGPNGAGKTTTIRLLMGMIHPSRGSASIFGLDCQKQAVQAKRQVGYVPGELPQLDCTGLWILVTICAVGFGPAVRLMQRREIGA